MGIFSDEFKELKKASEPLYKSPKSVQETIEIKRISESGIFEVADNRFSKCYTFADINYKTRTHDEKVTILENYCDFLNSMDCNFKITGNKKNKDMERLEKDIMLSFCDDGFDDYRKVYNDIIDEKTKEGTLGFEKESYITVTVERQNFEEAKAHFNTIEAGLKQYFNNLGSGLIPLNANERLRILHDFYRMGRESEFNFDIKDAKKTGTDFINDICNDRIKYFNNYIEDDNKFVRALYIKRFPRGMSEEFLINLLDLPMHLMVSVDIIPIPKDLVIKLLQKKYLGVESDIIRQQRVRNKNNDFSTDVSYLKLNEKKQIQKLMDDVNDNDQGLFYMGVTIVVTADSKEELEKNTKTIEMVGKGKGSGCVISVCDLKQREAVNTALPIGVRQTETLRIMTTSALTTLQPFNIQELNDVGGNYYGINAISKTVNTGNRKKLINGNGFVFGVPGSGKSFFCKMEMGNVFLNSDDDIIIIDPQNEYFEIAKTYAGTVVNMSTYTDNYVNPLDMDVWSLDTQDSKGMIREKGEFMLGLCEQCSAESLNARQKSIIDRCVRMLYRDIARSKEKYVPVMSDFYELLLQQPEPEAKDIALSLELFVTGSLNIFNHQTNVDVNNRFTVYGIRDLGTELSPITMLVMMEAISKRIVENGKKGKATWLFIDEFHVLLNSEYSAKYLQQLWKKVRKQGGLCTGITQNVVDLLQNYTATTMLSNSEFVVLLKQGNADLSELSEVIGVSNAQLKYVENSEPGTGLIKCGNVIIPFDNRIGKDTGLYRLYNTNLHEIIEQSKRQKDGEKQK